jgi:hypothetical protein
MHPAFVALFLAIALLAPGAQAQQAAGAKFEADAIVVGHRLPLNGSGTMSDTTGALFLGGLYVSKRAPSLTDVLSAPGPKRLEMRLLRDITGKDMGTVFSQAMGTLEQRELSGCLPGLLRIAEVLNTKRRLSAGESFALDSVPGQGTFIRINGERVSTIEGTAFFGCLMTAYLGPKPADAGLKRTLLGGKPA